MFEISDFIEAKRLGAPFTGGQASKNTLRAYESSLKRAETLIGRPISTFSSDDASVLMLYLSDYATSTRNLTISALKMCFKWAIGNKRYENDCPFAGISVQKADRMLPVVLTEENLRLFFDAVDDPKYVLFFKLMYYGALRISEAQNLTINAIRDDGVRIFGKGAHERFVPLTKEMVAELRNCRHRHFVFEGRDGSPLASISIYYAFHKACKKTGLKFRPHNLRATSATHFHRATQNLAATQRFLGHSNPQTTMLYVQLSDQDMQQHYAKAFSS